jgi:hypothetical protein
MMNFNGSHRTVLEVFPNTALRKLIPYATFLARLCVPISFILVSPSLCMVGISSELMAFPPLPSLRPVSGTTPVIRGGPTAMMPFLAPCLFMGLWAGYSNIENIMALPSPYLFSVVSCNGLLPRLVLSSSPMRRIECCLPCSLRTSALWEIV